MNIKNKKAFHDYTILEQEVAGMVLKTEHVKAIVSSRFSLNNAYVKLINEEAFLISDLETIKLLLTKRQLQHYNGKVKIAGLTLIPLEVLVENKKFKLKIGLAKGKKDFDKRETEKNRSVDLENRRIVKSQKLQDK